MGRKDERRVSLVLSAPWSKASVSRSASMDELVEDGAFAFGGNLDEAVREFLRHAPRQEGE